MTKDWVHGVGPSPVCQTLLQIVATAVITSSPPAWTSSSGMLSTQLISLSSMIVQQPPLLCERLGGHPLCLSGDSPVLTDLHCPCDCTAQCNNYYLHWFSISLSSARHFPELSWTVVAFFLLYSGQVFRELVCPLNVAFPRIFFNLTTLFSYLVFCCLFDVPRGVVVHLSVFLRFFRSKSFLSLFSPIVAQIKNCCCDPGGFFCCC